MRAANVRGPASSRLLSRGLIALGAASAIQLLIEHGWVQPWPDRTTATLISTAVALWGVIDLVRSMATPRSPRGK